MILQVQSCQVREYGVHGFGGTGVHSTGAYYSYYVHGDTDSFHYPLGQCQPAQSSMPMIGIGLAGLRLSLSLSVSLSQSVTVIVKMKIVQLCTHCIIREYCCVII